MEKTQTFESIECDRSNKFNIKGWSSKKVNLDINQIDHEVSGFEQPRPKIKEGEIIINKKRNIRTNSTIVQKLRNISIKPTKTTKECFDLKSWTKRID